MVDTGSRFLAGYYMSTVHRFALIINKYSTTLWERLLSTGSTTAIDFFPEVRATNLHDPRTYRTCT